MKNKTIELIEEAVHTISNNELKNFFKEAEVTVKIISNKENISEIIPKIINVNFPPFILFTIT